MAESFRLRSRRHVLRRADVLRHDDDDVGHRQRPAVVGDGQEGGGRIIDVQQLEQLQDQSHEGVPEALLGHLQQQSLL